jgi:hypothetical protein
MTRSAGATPRRAILLMLAVASVASAPLSWAIDGLTPSFVVYPLVLLVGIWRMRSGGGSLYLAITATAFLVVHLPWAWTAATGERTSPIPDDIEVHRFACAITLFVLPLVTAIAGLAAWLEGRRR